MAGETVMNSEVPVNTKVTLSCKKKGLFYLVVFYFAAAHFGQVSFEKEVLNLNGINSVLKKMD